MIKILFQALLSLPLAISSFANAESLLARGHQTVLLASDFVIRDSETKSLALDRGRHIKNLIVQAEGVGSNSMIEVMVNGEVKGTIYAPGRDPSYVVTVEDISRTIEFRHRSGGSMHISQVYAVVSDWSSPHTNPGGGFGANKGQVIDLATDTLSLIENLGQIATPEDFQNYLFPIKKNAGLVYVMSNAHGDLSKLTIDKLINLMDQIDYAQPYLDQLLRNEAAFDTVVELLTVRETLADWLDL